MRKIWLRGTVLYRFDNGLQFRRLSDVRSRHRASIQVGLDRPGFALPGSTLRVFAVVVPATEKCPDIALVVLVIGERSDGEGLQLRQNTLDSAWLKALDLPPKEWTEVMNLYAQYPAAVLTALFGWLNFPTHYLLAARRKLLVPIVTDLEPLRVHSDAEKIRTHMWPVLPTADALERLFQGSRRKTHPYLPFRAKSSLIGEKKTWKLRRARISLQADFSRENVQWRALWKDRKLGIHDFYTEFEQVEPKWSGWWPTAIDALADIGLAVDKAHWPAWLEEHGLPGHPAIDISSYRLLGMAPPPLALKNEPFQEFVWALED